MEIIAAKPRFRVWPQWGLSGYTVLHLSEHFLVYSLQFTAYSVKVTVYNVKCTVYTVYSVVCLNYNAENILHQKYYSNNLSNIIVAFAPGAGGSGTIHL